ncbi:MAG: ATP-binding protein [Flavobacteriales bacterium]|nr:ATP-binding protein [Flavobacteriales bacterium]
MNAVRISVTGPESTGKSHLSQWLSEELGLGWVPEVARSYLAELGRPYEKADLLEIMLEQLALEEETLHHFPQGLVADTDPLVIEVWSEFNYGDVDPVIAKYVREHRYDQYLLCDVDLPWEPDPLREHPEARKELMNIYIDKCAGLGLPFSIVSGTGEARNHAAHRAVRHLFK